MGKIFFHVKILWFLVCKGHLKMIFQEILRMIYSNKISYGFKRDLNLSIKHFEPKILLSVRKIQKDDIPILLNLNEPNIDHIGIEKRLIRLKMLESRIETCYVAATQDGIPCHMQWLIQHHENDKLKNHFGEELPALNKDDVLLEYVFTLEKYRRLRTHLFITEELFHKAKAIGARWAIVFVRLDNEASLKSHMQHGFVPYIIRHEKRRFFTKRFYFKELDANKVVNIVNQKRENRDRFIILQKGK